MGIIIMTTSSTSGPPNTGHLQDSPRTPHIRIVLAADGFLYKMARIISGTLPRRPALSRTPLPREMYPLICVITKTTSFYSHIRLEKRHHAAA